MVILKNSVEKLRFQSVLESTCQSNEKILSYLQLDFGLAYHRILGCSYNCCGCHSGRVEMLELSVGCNNNK